MMGELCGIIRSYDPDHEETVLAMLKIAASYSRQAGFDKESISKALENCLEEADMKWEDFCARLKSH